MTNAKEVKVSFLLFITMFLLGGIQNTKELVLEQVQHSNDMNVGQVGNLMTPLQNGLLGSSLWKGDRKVK